ncbi:hypothetical protein NUACC26_036340 [Scytonema sp. NUACC26]
MRDLPCLLQRLIQNAIDCLPYRFVKLNRLEERVEESSTRFSFGW